MEFWILFFDIKYLSEDNEGDSKNREYKYD